MLLAIQSGMFSTLLWASATESSENDLKRVMIRRRQINKPRDLPENGGEDEVEPGARQAAGGQAQAQVVGAENEVLRHGAC
jgi:hypothetical protein